MSTTTVSSVTGMTPEQIEQFGAEMDAIRKRLVDSLGEEDAALAGVENHETLQPLVKQLPERERTILALRFVHDMTHTQIAERIGISQMHVSRLLARTLKKLREGLVEEDNIG